MRRHLIVPLPLLCALFACPSEEAELLDGSVKDSGPAGPVMVDLSTTSVDFGAVVVGTTDVAQLTITNPSGHRLSVSLSAPSGPDADRFERSVNIPEEGTAFSLEAGGVATLTVRVSADAEGALLALLAIDSCSGRCTQTVTLVATGSPTGIECPLDVDLGLANPGGCIMRTVSCVNRGNATERITAVELDPASDDALVLVEPVVPIDLAPEQSLSLDVRYCPEDVADHTGEIVVFTFEPFQTEQRIRLAGRGGGSDVSCTPTAIDFGLVGVGADVDAFVFCQNVGFEDARLMPRVTDSTEFSARGEAVLAPGDSAILEVRHMPASVGAKRATLEIASNDPDNGTIQIALSSEAIDIGPCTATIQPGTIDFGLSALGQEREGVVVVQNTGTQACLLRRAVVLPGSDPSFGVRDLPPIGSMFAPGERVKVTATYTPAESGTVEGMLDVSFSNPGTSGLTVNLAGQGGTQPLDVSPQVIDFGDVAVGCGAPVLRTITMRRIVPGMSSVVNASIVQTGTDFVVIASGVPAQLGFYDEASVTIGFTPSATGFASASLRIVTGGSVNPILIPIVARALPDTARTDRVTLTPRKVDVLLVVDDSCSMALSQAGLVEAADVLTTALTDGAVDANLAVVTTDMDEPTRSGRFLGQPGVLDSMSAGLLADLEARLSPGIDGSGDEKGIEAAVAAVSPPLTATDNAGFLRPDADLAVLILSDEDDFSDESPSIDAHVRTLRLAAGQGRLYMSAIVGPPFGADCVGPYGLGQVGERYAHLVGRVGGRAQLLSYCTDMRANLEAAVANLFGGTSVELSTRPVISTIAVSVDGTALTATDYAYEALGNRIVFANTTIAPPNATVEITYDAHCVSPTCGDGTTDAGEQCDDMNMSNDDACIECYDALCGDGFTNVGVEQCDDGNLITTDACVPTCESARCGDGYVRLGVEECDDGNTTPGDGCPALCRFYVETPLGPQTFVPLVNGSTLTFGGGADPLDDGVATATIPFAFNFYDQPVTTLYVSVNGFASVAPIDPGDSWDNDSIPATNLPDGIIAAWWDDLQMDEAIPGGADVSWGVEGTAPTRVFVIQWRDIRLEDQNTANHRRFTFQIALFEANDAIQLRYAQTETRGRVPSVASASAGIEDDSGSLGMEALGCSPACDGRPRTPQRPEGFPEDSVVTFRP